MSMASQYEKTQYFVSSYDRLNPISNVNPFNFTAYNKREPATRNSKVSENYYVNLRWALVPNIYLKITATGQTVTGIGTQFPPDVVGPPAVASDMVGGTITSFDTATSQYFSDIITAVTDATTLTTANSHTIAGTAQNFAIYYTAKTANGSERRMYGSIAGLPYIILELVFDDEGKTAPKGIVSTNSSDGNPNAFTTDVGLFSSVGTTVTGVGTAFTTAMVGGTFAQTTGSPPTVVYTDTILSVASATTLTTQNSHTVGAGATYIITYGNKIAYGGSTLYTSNAALYSNIASYILPLEDHTQSPHLLLYMYELPTQKAFLRLGGTVKVVVRDPTGSVIYIPEIDSNGNALLPLKVNNQFSVIFDLIPVEAFDPARFGPFKYMRGGWVDPNGR